MKAYLTTRLVLTEVKQLYAKLQGRGGETSLGVRGLSILDDKLDPPVSFAQRGFCAIGCNRAAEDEA